jgi:hypothetical protein
MWVLCFIFDAPEGLLRFLRPGCDFWFPAGRFRFPARFFTALRKVFGSLRGDFVVLRKVFRFLREFLAPCVGFTLPAGSILTQNTKIL